MSKPSEQSHKEPPLAVNAKQLAALLKTEDSRRNRLLQLADMVCGAVERSYARAVLGVPACSML